MSDEYELRSAGDGRVIVLVTAGSPVDRARILDLLVACGTDPNVVSFVETTDTEGCDDLDGVPVVVPVEDTSDETQLEEGVRNCFQAGGRVIVVVDGSYMPEGLHPIASNYGTQCGWSPEQLAPRLIGNGEASPLSGSGESVGWSSSRPVRCGR